MSSSLFDSNEKRTLLKYDMNINEEESMVLSSKNTTSTTNKRCICCSIVVLSSGVLSMIIGILLVYLIIGFVVFNLTFLSNHTHNDCLKYSSIENRTPSNWTMGQNRNCPALNQYRNVFNDYKVPSDKNWNWIKYPSRHSKYASDVGVSALLITQSNVTVDQPWVIVIHGYHGCNLDTVTLGTAGILFHNGYNVLLPDLRNHGRSQVDSKNPYATFGDAEHLDVLGGYDYLKTKYGDQVSIGLFGESMGGATALIAYDQEPNLKACFVDSPAANVYDTLFFNGVELTGSRFFTSIAMSAAHVVSRVKSRYGFPPFHFDPMQSCKKLGNRPLYIQQGYGDTVVPEFNSIQCMLAVRSGLANGTSDNLYSYFGDNRIYTNVGRDGCDNHCRLPLTDTEGFVNRLLTFFNKYL
jgi:pimeloyl-ACP methyl ester carboxylesterase